MKARLLAFFCCWRCRPWSFPAYKPWYNFYNFAYGAKARAMGNAFTAVADDLTAAFWNPAGLAAQRSPEFHLGYKTDHPVARVRPAGHGSSPTTPGSTTSISTAG